MSPKKALVIGCGIGGPAVALFLRRAGIDAEIHEAQSASDDEGGHFLNVSSNGLDVLKSLGLEQAVAAEGFPIPRMIMSNGNGKKLGEIRNGAAPGEGEPSVIVRRGSLHRTLREEAERQGIPIFRGRQLRSIDLTADQTVIAHFSDGSTAEGDFLIGCDGIHSTTRRMISPDAPLPAYTGLLSCGGFARSSTLRPTPDTQHFVFGKRAFFGYFVKESGEIWWFSNIAWPGEPRRSELAAIGQEEWRRMLLDLHGDDQPFIQDIIRATTGEIGVYPIHDLQSTPIWHKGPIVLMGDAAHATSPSAGQGASLALEDAIVLAKCLRDLPRLEDAFTAYERLRRERAEKIVRFARRRGTSKAASNAVTRWLRDLMLPLVLRFVANSRELDWVYAYRVDWNGTVGN